MNATDAEALPALRLLGRSSSHFTRVARIFALELGFAVTFEPILDLTSLAATSFGGNPALKMPVLVDDEGPLFGTENICRRLAKGRADVVLRGDVDTRVVANAEELVLHAMTMDVSVVLARLAAEPVSAKVTQSLEESLRWLDDHVGGVVAALPPRASSFVEVALFCLVEHLAFRDVLDLSPFARLSAFAREFGARPSAAATRYRFDAKA